MKKIIGLLQSQINNLRKNEGRIGEIRYSILSPSASKESYGEDWVLMNGQCFSKACCEDLDNVSRGECPSDSPVKSKDSKLWKDVQKVGLQNVSVLGVRGGPKRVHADII